MSGARCCLRVRLSGHCDPVVCRGVEKGWYLTDVFRKRPLLIRERHLRSAFLLIPQGRSISLSTHFDNGSGVTVCDVVLRGLRVNFSLLWLARYITYQKDPQGWETTSGLTRLSNQLMTTDSSAQAPLNWQTMISGGSAGGTGLGLRTVPPGGRESAAPGQDLQTLPRRI